MTIPANIWKNATTSMRVRALMILCGWSLEDLAANAGLTKQAWHKTLQRKHWTAQQVLRAARAFGIPAGDLIYIGDDCDMKNDPDLWAGEDL